MKKLLIITLALILIASCLFSSAYADELALMSYSDLIALHNRIVREIMSRPQWKQVEVPSGDWTVGEDIPAGTYSITSVSGLVTIDIWHNGKGNYSNMDTHIIDDDSPLGKISIEKGWIISISDLVVFAPPLTLGF